MTEKISNELYDAVQKLNRHMHRNRHRAVKTNEGIHRGRIRLLHFISKNDGIIQRDLAEMLDMRPSSLTEMITNLEKSSLVKREKDENDGRVMHVFLTDEGKKIIDDFTKVKDELPDTVFNCLTVEEKEKMLEIVNKVNSNLETIDSTEEGLKDNTKLECSQKGRGGHHRKHGRPDKFNHHRENKRIWI
ncbi:MarR family transcriptional regulator [Clostridium sartagoforme]|uniref:MarR family transcriptional regulator n=1 Tax=Clostridium sartagoforme TaxID=84031 RepID=A0A4S2DI63_9CLOT|nr:MULTISPECIES: MarR family transcriptional regulator [Clostridium]MBS5938584.1 MarR family transcriptional regulator [Clostridium sp.]TGY41837.1 MarR family transcriptional regulator [Clostridium sartagoforme]